MEKQKLIEKELGQAAAVLSVEQIPELRLAREQAIAEAEDIIASRQPEWQPGQWEQAVLPSDPITAAERLLAAEEQYGAGSHQYGQAHESALTDSRRALAEAYRKTTWEYFPGLLQDYDRDKQEYTAFGRSLIDITRDGLRWDEHAEERQRLANEYAEELTYHRLKDHELADSHWILTISPCPDHAIEEKNGDYSYVPEIEKMMIRGVYLQADDNSEIKKRVTEQAGLPGKIINQDVIHEALEALEVIEPGQRLDKTELHGTQILVDKSKLAGVLDFVELLDDMAGPDVFMGEWRPDEERNYSAVKEQAKARQWLLEAQAGELADYMLELARQGADHAWAAMMIENKVNDMMHSRARSDPRIAREAFGEQTARGYEEAILLDRQGLIDVADDKRAQTQIQAPPAAYCGAGSCGLRQATNTEASLARNLGLIGEIIADNERRCPKGHQAVVYGQNGKACKRCRMTEIRKKRSAKPADKKSAKNDPKKQKKGLWF